MPGRVLVVTGGAEMPVPDEEGVEVARAVSALGLPALVVAWDDPDVDWADAALVLIRSTWDYTGRLPEFLAWVARVEAVSVLANPAPVVRWNAHKAYLLELAEAGVPVVPTTLVRRGGDAEAGLAAADPLHGVVVKPAVSAGALGTSRHPTPAGALPALRALVKAGDALVQPYVEQIADGERSLVYVGGDYSHAVVKIPAAGGFLVHEHHGGSVAAWTPTPAEHAVAVAALALVPGGAALLCARVDLVGSPHEPRLMELELIEPFLFLDSAPGATARFAAVVAAAALAGDPTVSVADNAARRRYELRVGGVVVGVAAYGLGDGVITFTHTRVDPAWNGRGLGSTLVEAMLRDARRRQLAVVPECPFVAAYLTRHPEFADLVVAD